MFYRLCFVLNRYLYFKKLKKKKEIEKLADPHIESELSASDRLSVKLYRFSLVWISFGWTFSFVLAFLTEIDILERGYYQYWLPFHVGTLQSSVLAWLQFLFFFIPVGLGLFTLHLYNKNLLWLFRFFFLVSVVFYVLDLSRSTSNDSSWISTVALGFLLAGASGISSKEAFCFRFKEGYAFAILNFALVLGLFVASFWLGPEIPRQLGNWLVLLVMVINGGFFLSITIKKFQQPLHYDIGDKTKY